MDARIQVQGEARVNRFQTRLVWGILALISLIVGLIGAGIADQPAKIEGVTVFSRQPRGHDDSLHITTGSLPPVGGIHHSQSQDCGIYLAPIEPERAIHSMEHGAVWITYQPELPEADIVYLQEIVRGKAYLLLSPFPGQRSPVVLTAWGVQMETGSVRDVRVGRFIARYLLGPTTPERGAPCSGQLVVPFS
jgi:hypothetical protein